MAPLPHPLAPSGRRTVEVSSFRSGAGYASFVFSVCFFLLWICGDLSPKSKTFEALGLHGNAYETRRVASSIVQGTLRRSAVEWRKLRCAIACFCPPKYSVKCTREPHDTRQNTQPGLRCRKAGDATSACLHPRATCVDLIWSSGTWPPRPRWCR